MEKPYLKIKKVRDGAIVPSKRDEDAGYDLYGVFEHDFVLLKPGDIKLMPTGISSEIPKDWVLYVAERGSTGTKGLSRRCGVIDSGYRGEIFVPLNNTSNKKILFAKDVHKASDYLADLSIADEVVVYPQAKAIAQMMLLYCPHVDVELVDDLADSRRGEGALGSSNK